MTLRFGIVGALTPRKGHSLLLKALALAGKASAAVEWRATLAADLLHRRSGSRRATLSSPKFQIWVSEKRLS